jgi:small multidrug resistance pump
MIKTYLFLAGAVFCEVAGTMLLPVSQNFTKLVPTAALSFFYLCAFYLLTFVVNKLPIAIVYATWSGFGIFTYCNNGIYLFQSNFKLAIYIRVFF